MAIESYDPKNEPALGKMLEIMDFADNSDNTKRSYLVYNVPFLRHCHDVLHKEPLYVTHDEIRGFLDSIQKERELSNRTINHAISEVKKLLTLSGYDWDDNQKPHKSFDTPDLYVPSSSRVEELINSIDVLKKKAMVSIMYGSGTRVSETCHLKCSDIHHKDGYIFIRASKRRKERTVPLSEKSYEYIVGFWNALPPAMKTRDWLFTQERNIENPADEETIQKYLKRHCKAMGFTPNITPHTLRRAFATHLYLDNIPIEQISKIMGHSSIETTMLYVHLAEGMLARSVKSPLDKLNVH